MMGNEEDARDALQETMIKAWRAIAQYEERAALSTWLYSVAVRCCQDMIRKRNVRAASSLDGLREEGYDPPSREAGPAEKTEAEERRRLVRQALSMLPEDQRVPLVLFAVEGRHYDEIAAMTGVALGTVKSRVNRGRERLREIMQSLLADGNNPAASASKAVKGGRRS